ncbi:putative Xaa-Pro aminopeptidase 3 [Nymphaea thermarum]|nr:putative Xaa-Pro aminopeptidase 3 [Nymphaea thermarum]
MHSAQTVFDAGQPTHSSHPELLEKGQITPGITELEYISRRKKLLEMLPEGSLAILASAPVKMMTDVVPYPFRQESDYLYITGCQQPGGVAVLSKDFGLWMFMPEPSPQMLADMVDKASMLFLNVGTSLPNCLNFDALGKASRDWRIKDLGKYTHEMRWIKSPSELKLMKESASIACQAILQTMLFSKSSPHEAILAAKVEYECKLRGAQRMAFNPVVGGGENGSVIHYSRNDKRIRDVDLVLMDVGCESHGYLSDITRTWPPCGGFSPSQVCGHQHTHLNFP